MDKVQRSVCVCVCVRTCVCVRLCVCMCVCVCVSVHVCARRACCGVLLYRASVSVSLYSWTPIIDYVNEQYDNYFRDESGLNRKNLEDHRVHCCLYFINPSTHG